MIIVTHTVSYALHIAVPVDMQSYVDLLIEFHPK